MARIPLLGRLKRREYVAIFLGSLFVVLETLISFIIAFLPKPVIRWFYDRSRSLFHYIAGPPLPKSEESRLVDHIRRARDFEELCTIFGYVFEDHVVLTKDGYLLTLHRLCQKKGEQRMPGTSTVWVCLTSAERNIPFVLVELGYDVWLGNNRGNKYSKKSIYHDPHSTKFWDYSIDNFAWNDIPDSIDQGTAQAFAALSIHPPLNQRVNVFIALAPAMSPAGLAAPIIDGLMKASPTLLFLMFGRRAILSSAPSWQNILYPPIFASTINLSLKWLFNWDSHNISRAQRLAAYTHLYSYASVKSIVHWFQIMRTGKFQMYDDDVQHVMLARTTARPSGVSSYLPARFPTRNIASPVVLLYGDSDSLVDIEQMLRELPSHTIAKRLHGYEHLDVIWGKNVHQDVIPHVIEALKKYCVLPERVAEEVKLVNGYNSYHYEDTSGYSTPGMVANSD
ncbi:unnamed protein product [Somion occarium]|uniref:Partial AB-hydrolase lipase domain-containing protein n=1 Tax=Somion occarium TaxID=3059160 RepID=A0ABP1DTP3_9APHY